MIDTNVSNTDLAGALPPPMFKVGDDVETYTGSGVVADAAIRQHPGIVFLNALFESGDRLCIQLIHATERYASGQPKTEVFFQSLAETANAETMRELQQKQAEGWHVYACMSPFLPEAGTGPNHNRVEELISEIRNAYMEVDEDGAAVLADVRQAVVNGEIPQPRFVIQSSPGKYQFEWRLQQGVTLAQQRALNEALVNRFRGDRASVDGVRVLRIPGFLNLKPEYQEGGKAAPEVKIIGMKKIPFAALSDFRLELDERKAPAEKIPAENKELCVIKDYVEAAAAETDEAIKKEPSKDGIERIRLNISKLKPWGSSGYLWTTTCPWLKLHTGHKDSGTAIIMMKSGALAFSCQHNNCADKKWTDFRPWMENVVGHKLPFSVPVPGVMHSVVPSPEPQNFHLTELGNAKRLIAKFGADVRFNHEQKKWIEWNGKIWTRDRKAAMKNRIKLIAGDMLMEAAKLTNLDDRDALVKWALRSESEKIISGGLALAASEVPVLTEEFDRDIYLLNLNNGTLDLRSMEFFDHRRENMLTKLTPVDYDAGATCPRWERFLTEVMDAKTIPFLQRAVGYSLTGFTGEHCLFLLHGLGRNGKSVFLSTVQYTLGDYAMQTDWQSFTASKNGGLEIRNDIARLHGARFVAAVESEQHARIAESLIKTLTGGDMITARFLYQEAFEFQPQFKLWLATNHKPKIVGTDEAIWSRIKLIPFSVTVPVEKRDKHLTEILRTEASGVLNWAIEGLRMYNLGGLGESETVVAATAEYRKASDVLQHFIDARCELSESGRTSTVEIYQAYKGWAETYGEYQIKERDFGTAMEEHGFQRTRTKNERLWQGITLTKRATNPVAVSLITKGDDPAKFNFNDPDDEEIPF